jgi:hypothetical protein
MAKVNLTSSTVDRSTNTTKILWNIINGEGWNKEQNCKYHVNNLQGSKIHLSTKKQKHFIFSLPVQCRQIPSSNHLTNLTPNNIPHNNRKTFMFLKTLKRIYWESLVPYSWKSQLA